MKKLKELEPKVKIFAYKKDENGDENGKEYYVDVTPVIINLIDTVNLLLEEVGTIPKHTHNLDDVLFNSEDEDGIRN